MEGSSEQQQQPQGFVPYPMMPAMPYFQPPAGYPQMYVQPGAYPYAFVPPVELQELPSTNAVIPVVPVEVKEEGPCRTSSCSKKRSCCRFVPWILFVLGFFFWLPWLVGFFWVRSRHTTARRGAKACGAMLLFTLALCAFLFFKHHHGHSHTDNERSHPMPGTVLPGQEGSQEGHQGHGHHGGHHGQKGCHQSNDDDDDDDHWKFWKHNDDKNGKRDHDKDGKKHHHDKDGHKHHDKDGHKDDNNEQPNPPVANDDQNDCQHDNNGPNEQSNPPVLPPADTPTVVLPPFPDVSPIAQPISEPAQPVSPIVQPISEPAHAEPASEPIHPTPWHEINGGQSPQA